MATMMNGYRFDMAKEGANKYSVLVNQKVVISGSNYPSALGVYQYIEESIDNSCTPDFVELIKEYDGKTKTYVEEVKKDNNLKLKKRGIN